MALTVEKHDVFPRKTYKNVFDDSRKIIFQDLHIQAYVWGCSMESPGLQL